MRNTVVARQPPRGLLVQCNLYLYGNSGGVQVKEYEETLEGLIESCVERYEGAWDQALFDQWKQEYAFIKPLVEEAACARATQEQE